MNRGLRCVVVLLAITCMIWVIGCGTDTVETPTAVQSQNIQQTGAAVDPEVGDMGADEADAAILAVQPSFWDFGTVNVNTTSAAKIFTIKNRGTGTSLTLKRITEGSGSTSFYISSMGTCRIPMTLKPAQACTFSVKFRPTAAGSKSRYFTAVTSIGNKTMTASGTGGSGGGTGVPDIDVQPRSVHMTLNGTAVIKVFNLGSGILKIGSIANTLNTPDGCVDVTYTTDCSGAKLGAGAKCKINLSCTDICYASTSNSGDVIIPSSGDPNEGTKYVFVTCP